VSSLLKACEVSFAYLQDGRGLQSVSLQIEAGEAMLVGGPSGCGKSTLARCLAGLIPHLYRGQFGGEVRLSGENTADLALWRLAEQVGMVFQNPAAQMLASTVEDEILFGLENLGLPRGEMDTRLNAAIERFNLAEMRQRSPQTLSGGEQQKLALAAITARRPTALVLDEPLSMLDTTAAFEFVAHTQDMLGEGSAVVYCEHRQEYLRSLPGLQYLGLGKKRSTSDEPSAVPPWPLPGAGPLALQACGLSVPRGGRTVIQDLDLTLSGGKVTAVVGRNGVGKTTLFRALAGLQPYTGSIEVQSDAAVEKPQIGIVFQNPDLQLFNATVRDEILYRLGNPDMHLFEWLAAVLELERYANTPPLLLSEGEKRRVALATMLMRTPRHGLLLDEPALGQDEVHKAILLRLLRAYAGAGYMVVYSTHDLELAAQADMLVLLGPEGIAAQGPAADVMRMEGAWQRLGFVMPEWVRAKWCA
jgi:energy-coupling factor transporter ATP-binding protein EcfA2